MLAGLEQRRVNHGIDFSAAADAGTRIWITTDQVEGQALRITECRPAATAARGAMAGWYA